MYSQSSLVGCLCEYHREVILDVIDDVACTFQSFGAAPDPNSPAGPYGMPLNVMDGLANLIATLNELVMPDVCL